MNCSFLSNVAIKKLIIMTQQNKKTKKEVEAEKTNC